MADNSELRMAAARVAGHANLVDVRTTSLRAELTRTPEADTGLSYGLSVDFSYSPPGGGGRPLVISGDYEVSAYALGEDGDPGKDPFTTISFVLLGIFDMPAEQPEAEPYSPEEWEAFTQTTAAFALYPYARETVSMLTTRLGLPPLTLGMMRFALDKREAAGD